MSEEVRESAPVQVGGLRIHAIERVVVWRNADGGGAWIFGLVEPVGIVVRDASGERRIELPR